jgi:hypothetical protein
MNDTPTTDARWETLCCSGQSWYQIAEEMKLDCRQRERELTAVTEQRDRLAEALDRLERTAGLAALQDDPARVQARQALAAVKGRSHDH